MKAQKAKRGVMSPSLLENVPEKQSKDAHKRICLGMGEWTESSSREEEGNAANMIATASQKAEVEQRQTGAS